MVENSETILDILWEFQEFGYDYVSVSCEDTKDNIMPDNWTGAFHSNLLVGGWKMIAGNQFGIKTKTEKVEFGDYKTTFLGDQFEKSYITGEWKKSPEIKKEKPVISVNIPNNPRKVYLIFDNFEIKNS